MNFSMLLLGSSTDESEIPFFDLMGSKRMCQVFVRPGMSRENKNSGCIAIKTLDHTKFGSILRTKWICKIPEKSLIKRAFVAGRSWLRFDSGGLFDDHNIGVLVNYVFRRERKNFQRTTIHMDFNPLPGLYWVRTFTKTPTADMNTADIDDFANFASRKGRVNDWDKLIDTLSSVFLLRHKSKNHRKPAVRHENACHPTNKIEMALLSAMQMREYLDYLLFKSPVHSRWTGLFLWT
ncbi:hypothetical protein AOP6_1426 [Desulfuromonas sp. AOP6]|nr:hypothetical protein AOP6_1426 [Desulfuromonas sp. AOP6]